METMSNDRRISMDHLDETSFSLERAEAQRSISFPELSGYARVSVSPIYCSESCAPKVSNWRPPRVFSSEASQIPGHKNRAATARVPPPAKRLWILARPIAPAPGKAQE